MSKKFQVRFNLGAGENFMKWKVTSPNGEVRYFEPTDVNIYMVDCKLVNQKSTAQKIYGGANKTVCAWVECSHVVISPKIPNDFIDGGAKVSYNPRVTPNWVMNGENVDKKSVGNLVSMDRTLLTTA
jgi:hypothetical protein